MKRISVLIVLTLLLGSIGCSYQPPHDNINNEQLRISYKAVLDFQVYSTLKPFSLDSALKAAPLIVIASPESEPNQIFKPVESTSDSPEKIAADKDKGIIEKDQGHSFLSIQLTVIEVLKGRLSEKTIAITVPTQNAAFMDALVKDKPYIFCLFPAAYVGTNNWDTVTDVVFYLSESNQVVPLKDDEEHNKVMGITLESFKKMIQ